MTFYTSADIVRNQGEEKTLRRESHRILGEVISEELLTASSPLEKAVFRLGCREPDYNYLTYIKGSIRGQAFHGHNYTNARRYIRRLAFWLERETFHGILYHYQLGKLTHYILDAFTYVHNDIFTGTTREHIHYEHSMSPLFEQLLRQGYQENIQFRSSLADTIHAQHEKYLESRTGMRDDCTYSLSMVRAAVCLLRNPEVVSPFMPLSPSF